MYEQKPQSEYEEVLVRERVEVALKQIVENIEVQESNYPEVFKFSAKFSLFCFYFNALSPKVVAV